MQKILYPVGIALFLFSTPSKSQTEATLYFMESVPQMTYVNPVSFPRYKFSIGLPGSSLSISYLNNMFSFKDFNRRSGNSIDSDLDKLYNLLGSGKNAVVNSSLDLFRISVKPAARAYLTWNTSVSQKSRISLPEGVVGIFQNGDAAFSSGPTNIEIDFSSFAYLSSGITLAYRINKDLNFGFGVEWLKGIYDVTVSKFLLELSEPVNSAIASSLELELKSSGLNHFSNSDINLNSLWNSYKNNDGIAIDLGFSYRIQDRFTVAANVTDIGWISWKNDLKNYTIDPETTSYTFSQVDLERVLSGDNDYFNDQVDSVKNHYLLVDDTRTGYKTQLPMQYYISGSYEIRRNFKAGILFMADHLDDQFSWGISSSIHKEFGRLLGASISYTLRPGSYNNLGMGLSLNLAPLQFYLISDNLINLPVNYFRNDKMIDRTFDNTRFLNLRVGINYVFGWYKEPDRRNFYNEKRKLGIDKK